MYILYTCLCHSPLAFQVSWRTRATARGETCLPRRDISSRSTLELEAAIDSSSSLVSSSNAAFLGTCRYEPARLILGEVLQSVCSSMDFCQIHFVRTAASVIIVSRGLCAATQLSSYSRVSSWATGQQGKHGQEGWLYRILIQNSSLNNSSHTLPKSKT
jgi:hypothetical protein